MQAIKMITTALVIVLIIDFMFWFSWAISGQAPTTDFYFGAITQHIINLI